MRKKSVKRKKFSNNYILIIAIIVFIFIVFSVIYNNVPGFRERFQEITGLKGELGTAGPFSLGPELVRDGEFDSKIKGFWIEDQGWFTREWTEIWDAGRVERKEFEGSGDYVYGTLAQAIGAKAGHKYELIFSVVSHYGDAVLTPQIGGTNGKILDPVTLQDSEEILMRITAVNNGNLKFQVRGRPVSGAYVVIDSVSVREVISCTPTDCSALGYECGDWDDGCGNLLDCGSCGASEQCTSGSCVAQSIDCNDNEDCGIDGLIGVDYCLNDNVYRDNRTFTCANPGVGSSCTSSTTPQLVETCDNGCDNGDCTLTQDIVYINECQELNDSNTVYILNNNLIADRNWSINHTKIIKELRTLQGSGDYYTGGSGDYIEIEVIEYETVSNCIIFKDKDITLNCDNKLIAGRGDVFAVYSNKDSSIIKNCKIKANKAIKLQNSRYSEIFNNTLTSFLKAVNLLTSGYNKINNNEFKYVENTAHRSIYLEESYNNEISYNTGNSEGTGVLMRPASNTNTVSYNSLENYTTGIKAMGSNNQIIYNTIKHVHFGIWIQGKNNVHFNKINNYYGRGIMIEFSEAVVKNNRVCETNSSDYGFWCQQSVENLIFEDNVCEESNCGRCIMNCEKADNCEGNVCDENGCEIWNWNLAYNCDLSNKIFNVEDITSYNNGVWILGNTSINSSNFNMNSTGNWKIRAYPNTKIIINQ